MQPRGQPLSARITRGRCCESPVLDRLPADRWLADGVASGGAAVIKRTAADEFFSNAIRLAKDYTCEHCGKSDGRMECAHIVGRREKTLRWCTDNALCLCHYCHRRFTENPIDFTRWLESHIGAGMLELLTEKRRGILKDTKEVRAEVAKHYREEVKRMADGSRDLKSWN